MPQQEAQGEQETAEADPLGPAGPGFKEESLPQ